MLFRSVSKINVNTECQLSFAAATRKYIEEGKDQQGKGCLLYTSFYLNNQVVSQSNYTQKQLEQALEDNKVVDATIQQLSLIHI